MPPRLPGTCPVCGDPAPLSSDLCWACEEQRHREQLNRLLDAPRPARLSPPRSEPAWLRENFKTVECAPGDPREADLADAGYRLMPGIKDPHGQVIVHVWAKFTDEGR